MALYPTVPVCVQLTDYELETPHLGVVSVYRTVPHDPPSLYPPLFEVEPPSHGLPEYIALLGVHPHTDTALVERSNSNVHKQHKLNLQNEKCNNGNSQQKEVLHQVPEKREIKMVTKEVILNKVDGKWGLKTVVEGGRVWVTRVSRGGMAGRSGLRPGDQLVSVNGKPLAGLRDHEVHRVISSCPPVGIKFTFRTRKD